MRRFYHNLVQPPSGIKGCRYIRHPLEPPLISLAASRGELREFIKKVIIYGSRAKGTHRPGSDIDLTLVAPEMTLTDLLSLENQIDDLLLPYKVDLSLFHSIDNADLIEHIERIGVVFCKSASL